MPTSQGDVCCTPLPSKRPGSLSTGVFFESRGVERKCAKKEKKKKKSLNSPTGNAALSCWLVYVLKCFCYNMAACDWSKNNLMIELKKLQQLLSCKEQRAVVIETLGVQLVEMDAGWNCQPQGFMPQSGPTLQRKTEDEPQTVLIGMKDHWPELGCVLLHPSTENWPGRDSHY